MLDAFFLAAAVGLLVVTAWLGWAIRRRGRQQRSVFSRQERPLPLARVWDEWLAGDAPGAERTRREALFTLVAPAHREAVREDLLRFEARALAEPEPLLAIRRELMDSIDRRMINREILALPENLKRGLRAQSGDVIASDAEAEAYLAANELRLEILREYAGRRYGDRAPQDWFEVYERAALLKQRTARNYISRSMSGELNEEHDARHQAISLVDSQLRAHLLKVAPGTRFEKLAGNSPDE
ncbi:MAG TPA: hypothetical protein VF267_02910 [Gammaproteobacteria bacterium]